MPTITNKLSLGNLFGGKIASINYNFQTASQPSTATITIVSEDNTFLKPEFGELVSIPPFGFQMMVVERGTKKDTNYDVLQIELVESISEILDKELVLIFGEHTDLNYDLDNELYYINKSIFIPKSFYPSGTVFNPNVVFPGLTENYIKDHGDGVNVIGTARTTYLSQGSSNITGNGEFKNEPYWITFENGTIKQDISSYDGEFVYTPDIAGDITVIFGYTLKNLYLLFQSKGLSFDAKSTALMQDESIFFSDSGTFREVLASCLGKIGRSFYIDPFTQKIIIITNSDIARINNNLLARFSNFNTAGATQISLKESISDVSATHFVVKGDLEFVDKGSPPPDRPPRKRKQVFYKLESSNLTEDITKADVELIKRIAPAVFKITDEAILDKYLFSLGLVYDTENWGKLYGEKNYYAGDFQPVIKANPNQNLANPPTPHEWQRYITENPDEQKDLNGYVLHQTVGARPLYRGDVLSSENYAQSGSDVDFYQSVKDFAQLWSGTYFSVPMSKTEINKRQYDEMSSWEGGLDNSFDFEIVDGESLITEVDSLQFLVNLLKKFEAKTNYKVKEIAARALESYSESSVGTSEFLFEESAAGAGGRADSRNTHYVIASRKMFSGAYIESDDLSRLINSTFHDIFVAESEFRYLLYTKNGQNVAKKMEEACLTAFEKEQKKVRKKLIVSYVRVNPDEDPKDDSGQEDIKDIPQLFSIKNIRSKIQNFGSRSLSVLQNRYSEMRLFLENIQDLNPEFSGPLISTQIDYFRPPLKSDFDVDLGVDSISISISDSGVTTSISYSSKKFAQIDLSVIKETLGGNSTGFFKQLRLPAFRKNNLRM